MYKGLRGYILLLFLETISATGSTLTSFVLTLWAWETYGSLGVLAEVLAAFFIPKVILSPIAGVFVDRWSRKSILVTANLVSMASIVGLTVVYGSGALVRWHVWVLGFLQAVVAVFRQPALDASMGPMVPRDQLTRVNAFTQAVRPISRVSGPLLAGVLVGFVKRTVLLDVDAVTFLVAGLGTLLVEIPRPEGQAPRKGGKIESFVTDIKVGMKVIADSRPLLVSGFGTALFNVCGGAFLASLLLPMASTAWQREPFARDVAGVMAHLGSNVSALDAQLCAAINTLIFLGMLVGGFYATWRGMPFKKRAAANIALGVVLAGLCQGAMGVSAFGVPVIAALVMGFTSPWMTAPLQSIWIKNTPAAVQGRVLSSMGLLSQLTYPIGLLIVTSCSGFMTPSALFMASGTALALTAVVWLSPSLRDVDEEVAQAPPPVVVEKAEVESAG